MGFEVKIEGFDAIKISQRIYDNDRIGTAAASALLKHMSPYVPRGATDILMTSVKVKSWELEYESPYSHYQFVSKLMVSPSGSAWAKKNERKHYTDKDLVHSKEKNKSAGGDWHSAAMKEKGNIILQEIQRLIERG